LINDNRSSLNDPTIDALAANSELPKAIDSSLLTSNLIIIANAIKSDIPSLGSDSNETGGHQHHQILGDIDHVERIIVDKSRPNSALDVRTSLDDPNGTDCQEHRIIDNATVEGTREVFGDYLCDAARRVNIDGHEKAAVTIMLPKWGGVVDCLVSLDIREEEVSKLASALFNADVNWVRRNLHIALPTGQSIILSMPQAEVTLKGATNEAITNVFGPEICNAVNESPIRKREWEAGQQSTHCVSMIVTKTGAIINISLGLEGGLAIQSRLHPTPHPSDHRPS